MQHKHHLRPILGCFSQISTQFLPAISCRLLYYIPSRFCDKISFMMCIYEKCLSFWVHFVLGETITITLVATKTITNDLWIFLKSRINKISHFLIKNSNLYKGFLIMAYIVLRVRRHFCQMKMVINLYLTSLIYVCSSVHINF